MRRPGA